MHRGRTASHDIALLVVSGAACALPTPWISLPAALVLVLWLPGRAVIGWLDGVKEAPGRVWLTLAASLVFAPVLLTWLHEFTNNRWAILIAIGAAEFLLLSLGGGIPASPVAMFNSARARWIFGAVVLWIAVFVFASFWMLHVAGGVASTPAHDYIKHHAVMLSLEQHPLPLHNVFYAAGAGDAYYYYHYPYLVPAAIRALTGNAVSIPLVFGLTSALLAAVFIAMVCLIARDLFQSEGGALLAAACAGLVGGFDIVPALIRAAAGIHVPVTLDAWCPIAWRIHNFATQFLWCPQHVAALLTLLLCVHWLNRAPGRSWWIVIAPVAAASLFGSSVYMAMTIFPAAAVFVLTSVRRREDKGSAFAHPVSGRRVLVAVIAVALLGLILMAWQAYHYYLMAGRYAGGLTMRWERFPLAFLGRLAPPGPLANLLDVPWLVLVDFGLPAIACLLVARCVWGRLWAGPGTRLLILAGVFGVAAFVTVRSNVNVSDYGFRIAVMPAMALAVVCAGALLVPPMIRPSLRSWRKPVIVTGVLLGLPIGCWEVPATAGRRLIERRAALVDAGALGFLRRQIPAEAVVQGDPVRRLDLAALVDRQLGVLDPDCPHVVVFQPLDPRRMRQAMADVEQAFTTASSRQAWENLNRWHVDFVLAGYTERQSYGRMRQFDDPALFEVVYMDQAAAIYRLIQRAPPETEP